MRPAARASLVVAVLLSALGAAPGRAQSTDPEIERAAAAVAERFGDAGLAGTSLMLTADERARIEAAQDGRRPVEATPDETAAAANQPPPTPPEPPENRYLGGFLYVDGGRWAAWVDNQRIRPEANMIGEDRAVAVTGVSPDGVELSWREPGLNRRFSEILLPNQTFVTVDGVRVEGYLPSRKAGGELDVPPPDAPEGVPRGLEPR